MKIWISVSLLLTICFSASGQNSAKDLSQFLDQISSVKYQEIKPGNKISVRTVMDPEKKITTDPELLSKILELRIVSGLTVKVPEEIGSMKNLRILDLSRLLFLKDYNTLQISVPEKIWDLASLQILDARSIHVNISSEKISNFSNLEILLLDGASQFIPFSPVTNSALRVLYIQDTIFLDAEIAFYRHFLKDGLQIKSKDRENEKSHHEENMKQALDKGNSADFYQDLLFKQKEKRERVKNDTILIFYPDGKLAVSGRIINGKLDGNFKLFRKNGALKEERQYNSNVLIAVWNYYPDGKLKTLVEYDQYGNLIKSEHHFFHNGRAFKIINPIIKNEIHGTVKIEAENNIIVTQEYDKNQRSGVFKMYSENGILSVKSYFDRNRNFDTLIYQYGINGSDYSTYKLVTLSSGNFEEQFFANDNFTRSSADYKVNLRYVIYQNSLDPAGMSFNPFTYNFKIPESGYDLIKKDPAWMHTFFQHELSALERSFLNRAEVIKEKNYQGIYEMTDDCEALELNDGYFILNPDKSFIYINQFEILKGRWKKKGKKRISFKENIPGNQHDISYRIQVNNADTASLKLSFKDFECYSVYPIQIRLRNYENGKGRDTLIQIPEPNTKDWPNTFVAGDSVEMLQPFSGMYYKKPGFNSSIIFHDPGPEKRMFQSRSYPASISDDPYIWIDFNAKSKWRSGIALRFQH